MAKYISETTGPAQASTNTQKAQAFSNHITSSFEVTIYGKTKEFRDALIDSSSKCEITANSNSTDIIANNEGNKLNNYCSLQAFMINTHTRMFAQYLTSLENSKKITFSTTELPEKSAQRIAVPQTVCRKRRGIFSSSKRCYYYHNYHKNTHKTTMAEFLDVKSNITEEFKMNTPIEITLSTSLKTN